MKQQRPRWSGPLDCPPEQGFCVVLKPAGPTREEHLCALAARSEPPDSEGQLAPVEVAAILNSWRHFGDLGG
jgi:hypothetical protein